MIPTSSRSNRTRSHESARRGSSAKPPTAGTVLVVIACRDLDGDMHGVNAWPATGPDLELYRREADDGQDN